MAKSEITVNRAPVLTLWAAIVAERLGHDHATALTLGKAVAGLNAQSKGRRLGIYEAPGAASESPTAKKPARPPTKTVALMGRSVPVIETSDGVRAFVKGRPESPARVERYLEQKFGESLPDVEALLGQLAKAYPPKELAARAYELYERFRPTVPEGVKGWGAKGRLDFAKIRALSADARQ